MIEIGSVIVGYTAGFITTVIICWYAYARGYAAATDREARIRSRNARHARRIQIEQDRARKAAMTERLEAGR